MNFFQKTILVITLIFSFFYCSSCNKSAFKSIVVYKTKDLVITQIASNSFVHTSFKQTNDFGYVPCNGLIVQSNHEAIVFDTPTTDSTSLALIRWIRDSLDCKINAIIPTHFHDDCLGGLKEFHTQQIPSYGYTKTITLARENELEAPQNSFDDSLILKAGNKMVIAKFFGEGHTKDNIVGYFPSDRVMFGGCLIKEMDAGKGYLGDANIAAWPGTVEHVKVAFPNVNLVVPGHGAYGDKSLLDFTIRLFEGQ